MSELTPKDIADWHRKEAKKHHDLAAFHRKTAEAIMFSDPNVEANSGSREIKGSLTLEQLEAALSEKGGRVNHIAARLHVGEDVIWDFLKDPQCKFVVGDRGFIYPKNL